MEQGHLQIGADKNPAWLSWHLACPPKPSGEGWGDLGV
jgi:hypothetical protein